MVFEVIPSYKRSEYAMSEDKIIALKNPGAPAPVARELTNLSLAYGGENVVALSEMLARLTEYNIGLIGASTNVYANRRLRRHFLRNLLGPPSHQKEQKIGDELLPSAPRPSPLVWSGPNKGSGHRSQMTRRPVAMPCVRPPTAAIASTFGLTPGARASGDYSTRSLTRSMSRSG
ncbi:hypothetical protein sS8_1243 [Methylocaldum marinum]|uniref:Uncharacterized protein n=1 Tax=Methylocaldum marinum TaxID=1432792 RepID=A0A250KNF4_9GAMM|nr:hypothetical protein [Methylocaldum marinum]BBA33205.1 hypothetical protein sS8_1243 [Methylocaldum marinum]